MVAKHKCDQVSKITKLQMNDKILIKKLDKIEKNTDDLLKFKWQIMGGTATIVALFGVIATLAELYAK